MEAHHMEVQLSAVERIILLISLPRRAGIGLIRTVHKLRGLIDVPSSSYQEFGITKVAGATGQEVFNWDTDGKGKTAHQSFSLSASMVSAIHDILKEMDTKKDLPEELIDVYLQFFPPDVVV